MTFLHIIMVGFGGFFGAIARYAISKQLNQSSGTSIPKFTLTVNLVGSLLLGVLSGVQADVIILLVFGTGFLGAFTTFSTLKLEMTELYRNDHKRLMLFYTIVTYSLGIALAYLGYLIGDNF